MTRILLSEPLDCLVRDRRRRIRLRWLPLALVAVLARAIPAAADVPDPSAVASYAKQFDLSSDEAAQHLTTQLRAMNVLDALRSNLGDQFAGIWFDNQTGRFVIPVARGPVDGAAIINKAFGAANLENQFVVVPVQSSWSELTAADLRLNQALAPLFDDNVVKTSLDPRNNAVVVDLASGAGVEGSANVQSAAAAETVKVIVNHIPTDQFNYSAAACNWPNCDPPLRGGVQIGSYNGVGCTAGFNMVGNQYGTHWLMTAGHCLAAAGSANWFANDSAGYSHLLGSPGGYVFGGGYDGDAGIVKSDGSYWDQSSPNNRIVHWGTFYNINMVGNGSNYVGEYVCHSGATSGTTCGNVTATGVKATYQEPGGNVTVQNMVQTNGMCTYAGDSGGPVYTGDYPDGYANGIFSGGVINACTTSYYADVVEMENTFGVHLRTN